MFPIILRDVPSVNVDAAGITLGGPPLATLGGLILLRMAMSFWRTLVCHCFFPVVVGAVSHMDSTRSVAALTVRSASKMDGVAQCAGYNFPTA